MDNYYEILHVVNFAEIEVVRAAYRAVSKLYHPDINPNADPDIMKKINIAFEVLGDSAKKTKYDEELLAYLKTNENDFSFRDYAESENRNINFQTKKEPKSKLAKAAKGVGGILWFVVDSFLDSAREVQKEAENAYYQGCGYDDWQLIRKYLKK